MQRQTPNYGAAKTTNSALVAARIVSQVRESLGFHTFASFLFIFFILLRQAIWLNLCSLSARVGLMCEGLSNFVPESSPQDTPEIASSKVAITIQELTSQEFQPFSPSLLLSCFSVLEETPRCILKFSF